ncbi:MAG: hypothetical protein ACD_75C00669G0001 [uncultured bacterium]|nr:MAG: hypothetical protein ACD_75C00669G0001 [uncultured bacterium]
MAALVAFFGLLLQQFGDNCAQAGGDGCIQLPDLWGFPGKVGMD